jgi:hypothetical protein
MTLPIGATPASGAGAVRKDPCTVCIQGTFTTSTGAFVATGEPLAEYSLGSFTAGVAALTFPKHLTFLHGFGTHNTDSATEALRHHLEVRNVNYAAGTAVVRLVRADYNTEDADHSAPTGTLKLVSITGD